MSGELACSRCGEAEHWEAGQTALRRAKPPTSLLLPYPHRQRVPAALLRRELRRPLPPWPGVADRHLAPVDLVDPQDRLAPERPLPRRQVDLPWRFGRVEGELPLADRLLEAGHRVGVPLDGAEQRLGRLLGELHPVALHRLARPVALHGGQVLLVRVLLLGRDQGEGQGEDQDLLHGRSPETVDQGRTFAAAGTITPGRSSFFASTLSAATSFFTSASHRAV